MTIDDPSPGSSTTALPADLDQILRDAPWDDEGNVPLATIVAALVDLAKRVGEKPEYLIVSGILAREAMRRLAAWSAAVRDRAEPKIEEPFDAWRALGESDYAKIIRRDIFRAERAEIRAIERAGQHVLVPRARVAPERKVSLAELVDLLQGALAEAQENIERAREVNARREVTREARAAQTRTFHDDDPYEQLAQLILRLGLARIEDRPDGVPLREISTGREDLVDLLQAALVLAKTGRVALVQEEFPTSPLRIRLLPKADERAG